MISRNKKAISKIILIILLLASFTLGAILSYMYTIGYYVSKGYKIPEKTNTLTITNATFLPENAKHFNFTILNPSYSPDPKVNITRIVIQPEKENTLYNVTDTEPELPYEIKRGTAKTFKCNRNWGEFAGQNITIHVFAAKASGATYSCSTSFVKLIVNATFESVKTVEYFNVTVRNDPQSTIGLNITSIEVPPFVPVPPENITPSLTTTHWLPPGNQTTFICACNWKTLGIARVTVTTSQGYKGHYSKEELPSVHLTIPEVSFNATDSEYYFDITVQNHNASDNYVNVGKIVVTRENGTTDEINGSSVNPKLIPPYLLDRNSSVTFRCPWDWRDYRNKNVTITLYTTQGLTSSKNTITPPSVILKIVGDPYFNLADTSHFNVTVQNSLYSLRSANITKITVADTVITGNDTVPTLIYSYSLGVNRTQSFVCTWETWDDYKGENVTTTVHYYDNFTLEENEASHMFMIPFANITKVSFDSTVEGVKYFNVTVYNGLNRNITISKIVAIVENEESFEIDSTLVFPSSELGANETATFVCVWNWVEHEGKEVTILLRTTEELEVAYVGVVHR